MMAFALAVLVTIVAACTPPAPEVRCTLAPYTYCDPDTNGDGE